MAERSLTDLKAVRPRGPRIFVALVVLLAASAGVWWFFLRPKGPVGEPEDPTRIVLISESEQLSSDLEALGFTVRRVPPSSPASNAGVASEDVGTGDGRPYIRPSLRSGAQVELARADAEGFGYVVFENPSALSFGDMAVSSDSDDVTVEHRFAVFSAGELAFPHHVTVDTVESLYELPPTVRLLRALFAQHKLAAALLPPNERSIEAGPVAETLEDAVDLIGAYNALGVKARRIARTQSEELTDEEIAEPKPTVLAGPLDRSRVFPAGGGGLLLFLERPTLASPKTHEVSLDPPGGFVVTHLPPEQDDLEQRQPCSGMDPQRYFRDPKPVVSSGAQAIAFGRGRELEVWVWNGTPQRCGYAPAGRIDTGGAAGELGERGQWLRVSKRPEVLVMEIFSAQSEAPTVIELPGCTHVGHPTWVGPDFAAVGCIHDPEVARTIWPTEGEDQTTLGTDLEEPLPPAEAWIYYVRLEDSRIVAHRWPQWSIDEGGFGLLAIPGGDALRLMVMDDARFPRWTWSADASLAAIFEASTATASEMTPERPGFVSDADKVNAYLGAAPSVERLDLEPTARNVRVSPDGRFLTMEVDGDAFVDYGRNVALYDLQTKTIARVANNRSVEHFAPHFTSDGRRIAFNSRYGSLEKPRTAARLVPVPVPVPVPEGTQP